MNLKRLILLTQILIFLFVDIGTTGLSNVARADDDDDDAGGAIESLRLPDGYLLSSIVKFKVQEQTNMGLKIADVTAYQGRYGATLPAELRRAIIADANKMGDNVRIIWTLKSTYEEALLYQQKLIGNGIKTIIVNIPDEYQERILARQAAAAAGFYASIKLATKETKDKILSPVKTLTNMKKIFLDQFKKPNGDDLFMTYVKTTATTAVVGSSLFYSVGVSPSIALGLTIARLFWVGSTTLFGSALKNWMQFNMRDDFMVSSVRTQFLRQFGFLGLGISEVNNELTEKIMPAFADTRGQMIADNIVSRASQAPLDQTRSKIISSKKKEINGKLSFFGNIKYRMTKSDSVKLALIVYGLIQIPSQLCSALKIKGPVFTLPESFGSVQITTVQGGVALALIATYIGINLYYSPRFEQNAKDWIKNIFKTQENRKRIRKLQAILKWRSFSRDFREGAPLEKLVTPIIPTGPLMCSALFER